jgi:hypothetical protein
MTNAVSIAQSGSNNQTMRNRIINGAMVIDQRNNGASVSVDNAFLYTLDRWGADEQTDGAFTVQQSSVAPAGFTNSLLVTTTTADSSLAAGQYAYLLQAIEGFNCADLAFGTASAQPVTLSFWVRSSLTGTFGGAIRNYGSNRAYPFTYSISAANTWEYKTVTIPGDTTGTWLTNNSGGLVLALGLGVGSTFSGTAGAWTAGNILSATGATNVLGTLSATWQITGVQLEEGTAASPFENRLYSTELALCQRYLPAFNRSSANAYVGTGWIYNTTNAAIYVPFQVVARTNPTGVTATGLFAVDSTVSSSVSSISLSTPAIFGTTLIATTSTTITAGQACGLVMLNSSTQILFTGCEL